MVLLKKLMNILHNSLGKQGRACVCNLVSNKQFRIISKIVARRSLIHLLTRNCLCRTSDRILPPRDTHHRPSPNTTTPRRHSLWHCRIPRPFSHRDQAQLTCCRSWFSRPFCTKGHFRFEQSYNIPLFLTEASIHNPSARLPPTVRNSTLRRVSFSTIDCPCSSLYPCDTLSSSRKWQRDQ